MNLMKGRRIAINESIYTTVRENNLYLIEKVGRKAIRRKPAYQSKESRFIERLGHSI